MAGKSGTRTVKARVVPEDLEAVVREALRAAPGTKSTQLKKALPKPYQAFAKEALSAARELVARQAVFCFPAGKAEAFFERDPQATLDELAALHMPARPLEKEALRELLLERAPGHAVAFDPWLKRALERGAVHEHAAAPPSKKKRYGSEPDVTRNLVTVLTTLRKALAKTDAQGISRQSVADALLAELGLAAARPPAARERQPARAARDELLAALDATAAESPRQALLSIREVRTRATLGKELFDAVALELMREGKVSLHHHDHPASLPETERGQLVRDPSGNYYIGIAPRSGP